MTGNPAQCPSVLIIDLSNQETTAPRVNLGRCNTVTEREIRPKTELAPSVIFHKLVELRLQRGSARVFEKETKKNETKVTIN